MEPIQPEAERLRGRVEQLEQLTACLQKALGHELPNQFVAVQGMAKLLELEEADRLTADGRDYLERLATAARRAHESIVMLAQVCRAVRQPERGGGRVFLNEAVNEAAAQVKRLFSTMTIEYNLPDPSPPLAVPRTSLRRVLLELFKNAARAAEGRPLRVVVQVQATGTGPELRVEDDGCGMTAEQLRRLFEPFACSVGGGSGLGLFLVRQLVENWGGTVRVESRPGCGTTVVLALPPETTLPQ